MKKIPIEQNKISKDFQFEIIKSINSKNLGKNIMISPISIYHLLSFAANGAENTTLEEMLQLIGHKNKIDLNKKNSSIFTTFTIFRTLKMANALFK